MTSARATRETVSNAAIAVSRALRVFFTLRTLTPLCELQKSPALSLPDDNCNREFSEVYSRLLHKGKPAARRGRKASGPAARVRRIAGLPGRGSSERLCRQRFPESHMRCSRGTCEGACQRGVTLQLWFGEEEQRKLKRANPSKGGDAKPPVYRISSYDSGVTSKASHPIERLAAPCDRDSGGAVFVSLPVHSFRNVSLPASSGASA